MTEITRRAAFGAGLALAAPRLAGAQAAPRVLRFVPQADLRAIDPVQTNAYITRNFGYLVFDTLFALDANYRPQPQMVERWTVSDDRLTWRFILREGLSWHDGTPVAAADCVASVTRWAKRDTIGLRLMATAQSLSPDDARSFTLHLREPFAQVLAALAKPSSLPLFMMPERLASLDPATAIPEAIGSGPYRMIRDEWDPGNKVVFARNAAYRSRPEPASFCAGGKAAHFDRVEWISMPDAATATAALTRGEVDWYELPPFDLLPSLARARNVSVARVDPLGSQALMRFNQLVPPFDKLAARHAIAAAVSQEDYLTAIAGDAQYWRTCNSVYACGTPLSSEAGTEILRAPRSLDRARALLRESGYAGEKVIVLSAGEVQMMQSQALVTADLLKRLGMNVELQATDQGAFFSRRNNRELGARGSWHVFHTWITALDTVNPSVNFVTRADGGYAGWNEDAGIERLRADWLGARDEAEGKRLADEVQRRTLEQVNYIPLGQFYVPTAFRSNLTGIIEGPLFLFWNVRRG
ncbi:ABC transporter substrate-binding protein (plasmid) [Roseomonas sp. CCTCC AB2023176]|uniref:ABC transporter substrate-binding protein n=1 Tax=Roseomonas sp. CCTCC AB2023176 TaxID=3342640 RepID=UPI0035DEE8E2